MFRICLDYLEASSIRIWPDNTRLILSNRVRQIDVMLAQPDNPVTARESSSYPVQPQQQPFDCPSPSLLPCLNNGASANFVCANYSQIWPQHSAVVYSMLAFHDALHKNIFPVYIVHFVVMTNQGRTQNQGSERGRSYFKIFKETMSLSIRITFEIELYLTFFFRI